jgi:hypothetical protein
MAAKHNTPPPRASLADALFPKVRQRVLAVMFDAPQRSFYMGEVIALAQSGTGAVQRELADLTAAGLLSVQKHGKQKHYQANADSPVFHALSELVGKTMGVPNVLGAALEPLGRDISAAFVYDGKPGAPRDEHAPVTAVLFSSSLGSAGSSAVATALQGAANTLGRQLSFTLYTPESVASAVQQDSSFVARLLQAPKTWFIGSEDQLFSQAT